MRWHYYALLISGALAAVPALAVDPEMARFASAKETQARELAKAQKDEVPALVWKFFDAVRVDDWETATNLADRLERASGRYMYSDPAAISPGLRTAIWPVISETLGAYEQFHDWDNKWLHRYGREIIDSIPQGSIYFGGTDPGRFVISALSESHRDGRPFFTLTQNQLCDQTYLEYLRTIYSRRIYVPTTNDLNWAFTNYIADAQARLRAGKLRPGEDVRTARDGRVQVSGQVAVMSVNALIAKRVVEKNPDLNFYLEESFPLDWMFPHLSPHGLIFELHTQPLARLSPAEVDKDQEYWRRLMKEITGDGVTEKSTVKEVCDFSERIYAHKDLEGFKGDTDYARNEDAQKTFSKLRSAIAGVYEWRANQASEEDEKVSLRAAADLAFRQSLALYAFSPETVYKYIHFLVNLKRNSEAVVVAEAALRADPKNESIRSIVQSLRRLE